MTGVFLLFVLMLNDKDGAFALQGQYLQLYLQIPAKLVSFNAHMIIWTVTKISLRKRAFYLDTSVSFFI